MSLSSAGCLLGHKGRCFDTRLLSGNRILTASEDGTAKLFDINNKRCITTFNHGAETEVLRAACIQSSNNNLQELVCTCGANGIAYIWSQLGQSDSKSSNGNYSSRKEFILSHNESEQTEVAQIYSCESICTDTGRFLTAADNKLRLWDVQGPTSSSTSSMNETPSLLAYQTLEFSTYEESSSNFGGVRNPNDICYLFDAKVCPTQSHVIGVACSDGSTRLLDLRSSHTGNNNSNQSCTHILPINQFLGIDTSQENVRGLFPTAISFDEDHSLFISLSNGYILICDIRQNLLPVSVIPAHTSTCYGCIKLPHDAAGVNNNTDNKEDRSNCTSNSISDMTTSNSKDIVLTWGSDGYMRTWDLAVDYTLGAAVASTNSGDVNKKAHYNGAMGEYCINSNGPKASIYSCCIGPLKPHPDTANTKTAVATQFNCVQAYCGVSSSASVFLGTPVPIVSIVY